MEACGLRDALQKMGECVISLQTQQVMSTCQCILDCVPKVECDTAAPKSDTFMNLLQYAFKV